MTSLFACSSGSSSGGSSTSTTDDSSDRDSSPVSADIPAGSALFVAQSAFAGTTNACPSDGTCLIAQLESGDKVAVFFLDSAGEVVPVNVSRLRKLSDDWIALILEVPGKDPTEVLLRISTGTLYDISGFDIEWLQLVRDYLFAIDTASGTLYRIDLDGLTATPLNNPNFDPVLWSHSLRGRDFCVTFSCDVEGVPVAKENVFVVGNDYNVLAYEQTDGLMIFFSDNSPPLDADLGEFIEIGGATCGGLAYGEDGFIYQLKNSATTDCEGASNCLVNHALTPTGVVRTYSAIGSEAVGSNMIWFRNTYLLSTTSRHVLFTNGFYTMEPVTDGAFTFEFTELDLSDVPTGTLTEFATLSGGYLTWYDDSGVHRILLAEGAISEQLVADTNILSIEVVSGAVYYTKYITGTTIGTYRIVSPGVSELTVELDAEIRDIVELTPGS